jgi:phosphatidate cytidylyltransferase
MVLANWPAHLRGLGGDPWRWIIGTFVAIFAAVFLAEGEAFRRPGRALHRLGLAVWLVAYLGLLPCFLVQLRWIPGWHGTLALALAIFVPKLGDVGAFTVGTIFGRHRMTPVLSPRKTWEGALGCVAAAVLAAIGINALSLLVTPEKLLLGWFSAAGFGLTVGVTAMLGDLMASLIKRDCETKDSSNVLPGFGGVLDLLDSVIFSAPVAYLWLAGRG